MERSQKIFHSRTIRNLKPCEKHKRTEESGSPPQGKGCPSLLYVLRPVALRIVPCFRCLLPKRKRRGEVVGASIRIGVAREGKRKVVKVVKLGGEVGWRRTQTYKVKVSAINAFA